MMLLTLPRKLLSGRGMLLFPFVLLASLLACSTSAYSQQNERPYNRFQFHKYRWQALHTDAFHLYFPKGYDSLCAFAARELPGALELIKKRMVTTLQKETNIIIYPSADQLYESNVGAFAPDQYTLPTVVLRGNRMLVAYNGSYTQLREDLREALVRSIWEEQFKTDLESQLKGTAVTDKIPYWFSEGAISYLAHGWTIADEDALRMAFQSAQYADWQQLAARKGKIAGAALCHYLNQAFYRQAVMQLFFQLKKKRSLPRAVRLITKMPADSLYRKCLDFYQKRFRELARPAILKPRVLKLAHPKGAVSNFALSPDQRYCLYTVTASKKRTVYIADIQSNEHQAITSYPLPPWIKEHSADPYPLTAWSEGNQVILALPRKGKLRICKYDLKGNLLQENTLFGVDGIRSLKPYGEQQVLLAAFRKAQSDIVSYDLRKEQYKAHTDDSYDDLSADMDATGAIVMESARKIKKDKTEVPQDTLMMVQGLFQVGRPPPVIYDTLPYVRWSDPAILKEGQMLATTTKTGAQRLALLEGSRLKTMLGAVAPYQLSGDRQTISIFSAGADSFTISQYPLADWIEHTTANEADTFSPWLLDYQSDAAERAKEDSMLKAARYTGPSFLEGVLTPKNNRQRRDSILQSLQYDPKKISTYLLQLHSAYFTARINNDYFINRYQPYTNYQGQFKFPEPGGMARGGFTDLFENHHFSLAYRMPAGTEGSDFFIRYENTARKTDWSLLWFRKVETLQPDPKREWKDEQGRFYPNSAKVKTNYYELSLSHPISYYLGINFQTAVRHDRTVFLATEKTSLRFDDLNSTWSISTLAAYYNKLRPTLPLLYRGFKARVFTDLFAGIGKKQDATYGAGVDMQYHQPLYRHITALVHMQAGTSGGNKKLLYNMGGVDNNLTIRTDSNVHFAQDVPYSFQTLVTPLRGHLQNSIYGNQFALVNLDVYFPLFQSLIPVETPLSFINNLQLGLFTDFAMAKETFRNNAKGQSVWSYGISARTTLAGYPIRADFAYPGSFHAAPVWYLSLSVR